MNALEGRVVHRIGTLELDLALTVADNEIVAIVGPNGAGKTTLLRVLSGLLALDDGQVVLDGAVLDDPRAGIFVPPERRPIGVVFQDRLLFAHLSARENVAFGLRARGTRKREALLHADELLARLGLEVYGDAKPRELSGGQAQRVALARALATSPRVLLLDEPLAALDATARIEVRRALRKDLTTYEGVRVLVTHDPLEALTLAHRIVVLEDGRVAQSGRPDELRSRPGSAYVAELLGINLLDGDLGADGVLHVANGRHLDVGEPGITGSVTAVIEPNAISLFTSPPHGSARNVWQTVVAELDHEPGRVRVRLGDPIELVADVTPASVERLQLRPGTTVWAAVKAMAIDVSPR